MPTTRTPTGERAHDTAWRNDALPPLSIIDRAALALGAHLILWGQRHADPAHGANRAGQARRYEVAQQVEADRNAAFERWYTASRTW